MIAHHTGTIKFSEKEKEKGRATLSSLLGYNLEMHTSLRLIAHVSVTKSSYMAVSSSTGGLVMGSLGMYPAELSIFLEKKSRRAIGSPTRSLCHTFLHPVLLSPPLVGLYCQCQDNF